ncbi:MAG: hypothetical protein R3E31_14990 [Chloroflexota bacterium]
MSIELGGNGRAYCRQLSRNEMHDLTADFFNGRYRPRYSAVDKVP